ncbi:MAG: T9SS type A sorting domain-containing protein [Saprospiraceae bacterium]
MKRSLTYWLQFLVVLYLSPTILLAQIPNNPAANGILGQKDFTSKIAGKGADLFNGPNGVAVDPTTGKLFVADRGNHRVLRWASADAMVNGSAAEAVLGQPDFETVTAGVTAAKMDNPIGIQVDKAGRLWVNDFSNNRILRFDNASNKPSGANADGVLGQPDFTSKTAVTSQNNMRGPVVSYLDQNGTLWVAEFNAHRVTRYNNAASKPNGAPADGVLGQPDFVTGSSALTATGMSSPNGLYVDADGRLWVSETGNRRVTRFDDAANKPNGAAADGVLGQPNFTTNTANVTQNGFSSLRYVTGDSEGRIYVIQEGSHRIVIFNNAASLPNGANADYIWGQADFTSGTAANPPTASSYNTPRAMFIDEAGGKVWVADWANHRVLRYDIQYKPTIVITDNPDPASVLGQTDFVSKLAGKGTDKFNGPNGVAVDPLSGKVFIADRANHRVLRWASDAALLTGAAAEAVLGQPDFETNTAGVSAVKMDNPIGVYVDKAGRLWVSDFSNNRVLRFDNASNKTNGAAADGVLGQPDFTSKTAVTSQSIMRGPVVSQVDETGTLWVAEFNAHRVTRYNDAANKANGAPADGVLGQPDFVTGTSALTATGMSSPNGVYVDADGRLWVSETGNRRVTRFDNAANKPNGAPADGVLGQPNFTTNTANITRNGFSSLRFVTGDSQGRIYVIQEGSHRIVIFNDAANLPNGADADYIWGQPDFTTGTAANPPTANSYNTPRAMFVDEARGNIWVADWGNNRVLRYGVAAGNERSLTLLAPTGGESWMQNTVQKIVWNSSQVENVLIEFSADNGANWTALATVAAADGEYEWTVDSDLTDQALVRISDASDNTVQDVSEAFRIIPTIFNITLLSPNGYQQWEAGKTIPILFASTNVDSIKIEVSYDNGVIWKTLAAAYATETGSYPWVIGETLSDEVLIRLADVNNAATNDVSAHVFSITEPRSGGEQDFIFFSDSPTPGFYDSSFGFANAPSTLKRVGDKLPVSTKYSLVGNYSLELNWYSDFGGDWGAAVAGIGWVGRDFTLKDTLSIKVFSEKALNPAAIPFIYVEDLSNRKSTKINLTNFVSRINANQWQEIKIPVQVFEDNPGAADLTRIKTIFFGQRLVDGAEQTLYLDDIRVTGEPISGDSTNVYVVLGSSTAAGTGASVADSSWVGRFRNYVKSFDSTALVINLAVGGYTSYDVMPSNFVPPVGRPAPKINNNITLALAYNPTAILINLPSNDATQGFTIEEQVSNLRTIVNLIEADEIPYRITTTQPRNLSAAGVQSLRDMRDSILTIFGENAANIFDELAAPDGKIKANYDSGDGIHVNNSGHKYIYDQIVGSGILDSLISTDVEDLGRKPSFLEQNFPNPAQGMTTIRYHLPEAGQVQLHIYDTQGRLVQQLVNENQTTGSYQLEWNTTHLNAGMYYCSITINGSRFARETMKVVVMK